MFLNKGIANDTNWITWHNQGTGNRTTRAHVADAMNHGRTLCGWSTGGLTTPAPKSMQRCKVCKISVTNNLHNSRESLE